MHAFALPSESDGDGEREEKRREGAARQAGSSSGLGVKNSDNIQATEQGHFSFQMTHCQAATRIQEGRLDPTGEAARLLHQITTKAEASVRGEKE